MSIEGKRAYRFDFLKSEWWQTFRTQVMVEYSPRCHICGKYDISNDVHHIRYKRNWRKTKVGHVVVLCRKHHQIVHKMMKDFPEMELRSVVSLVKFEFDSFWTVVKTMARNGGKTFSPLQIFERARFFRIIRRRWNTNPLTNSTRRCSDCLPVTGVQ